MKLWVKYLLGATLGILVALVLPSQIQGFLETIFVFALRFARYPLLPLLFFGSAMAVYKLRTSKKFFRTVIFTICVALAFSLFMSFFGIFSALIVRLPRIPFAQETILSPPAIDFKSAIFSIFPDSAFLAVLSGDFLLPGFLFAILCGAACASDPVASKPVVAFLQSATKICETIEFFFAEIFSVVMIAISCFWSVQAIPVFKSGIFTPLFLLLFCDFVIISAAIFPLILRFSCNDKKPFRVLFASLAPILVAFFSGDSNLSLLSNRRHGKESLGIHNRVGRISFPIFSIFARGGVSLVISVAMISILRFYTKSNITFYNCIWIFAVSFAFSFLLGAIPRGGTFLALAQMCALFGGEFSDGYLLLKSAAPILCSFACAFDAVCAFYASYFIAVKTKQIEHIEIRKYI